MDKQLVPGENIEIYCYLYSIETALRELIIELLSATNGPLWYKKRLPGDVLEKYRKGIEFEKSLKWFQLVPLHPIYYIDFPDLKKIIEREDNWKDAFKRIFSRKDILSSTLAELEFIRNKIAHNRKATPKDVEIVRGAHGKLSESIGENYFRELSIRCTCSTDISERLSELQKKCESTFCICNDCKRLEKIDVWESISAEWWFDESYLGHKLEAIADYFGTVDRYLALPRSRGSGHKIESWVKSSGIKEKYANAQIEFAAILSCGGEKRGSK
jgi:hypothetical protein